MPLKGNKARPSWRERYDRSGSNNTKLSSFNSLPRHHKSTDFENPAPPVLRRSQSPRNLAPPPRPQSLNKNESQARSNLSSPRTRSLNSNESQTPRNTPPLSLIRNESRFDLMRWHIKHAYLGRSKERPFPKNPVISPVRICISFVYQL